MKRCCCSSSSSFTTVATALTSSTTAEISLFVPLFVSRRSYFWPYNENFVPKGAETSRFQSSGSPGLRRRVLQEYALSPLFGAQVPCCAVGTMHSAKEVTVFKRDIQSLLCDLMRLPQGSVTLGPLHQMKEMMLYRYGTPLSPRLGDERQCRVNAYARRPIAARTIMDVFLKEDMSSEDMRPFGRLVLEQLQAAINREGERTSGPTSSGSAVAEAALNLVRRLGISYCEVPALDESGYVFDQVGGVTVTEEDADKTVQRWIERGEML